jgi:alkylation response protein AidB-like acyl-CoA dehydrogenase
MDFQLTEQQKLLKKSAREFMEREIIPIADEYDRRYRPLPKELLVELLRKLIPLGFVGGLAPEKYGGAGLDYLSYAILEEELARAYGALSMIEMDHHIPGVMCLYRDGTEEQKAKYLPPATAAEIIFCYCLTEPDVGSGARDIKTTAVPTEDGYILSGTKTWITNGTVADVALVVAVTDRGKGIKGMSLLAVEKKYSPFTARDLPKLGFCSCPTAEIVFDECRVPKENVLGRPGEGYGETMEIFQIARAGLAILGVGLAQAAIDASIKYARERRQFGRPIGSFQMIQEMIVDMVIETEAARLLTYQVFDLLDKGISCFKESSMAKAFAPEVAFRVTSKALQIHGAYGLSEEYPLERYFRDARALTIPDGTTEIQKLIVGREVLGLKAFA